MKALEKIRLRGDLSSDTLNYFLVKDPEFARLYLLPKISIEEKDSVLSL